MRDRKGVKGGGKVEWRDERGGEMEGAKEGR